MHLFPEEKCGIMGTFYEICVALWVPIEETFRVVSKIVEKYYKMNMVETVKLKFIVSQN